MHHHHTEVTPHRSPTPTWRHTDEKHWSRLPPGLVLVHVSAVQPVFGTTRHGNRVGVFETLCTMEESRIQRSISLSPMTGETAADASCGSAKPFLAPWPQSSPQVQATSDDSDISGIPSASDAPVWLNKIICLMFWEYLLYPNGPNELQSEACYKFLWFNNPAWALGVFAGTSIGKSAIAQIIGALLGEPHYVFNWILHFRWTSPFDRLAAITPTSSLYYY